MNATNSDLLKMSPSESRDSCAPYITYGKASRQFTKKRHSFVPDEENKVASSWDDLMSELSEQQQIMVKYRDSITDLNSEEFLRLDDLIRMSEKLADTMKNPEYNPSKRLLLN